MSLGQLAGSPCFAPFPELSLRPQAGQNLGHQRERPVEALRRSLAELVVAWAGQTEGLQAVCVPIIGRAMAGVDSRFVLPDGRPS